MRFHSCLWDISHFHVAVIDYDVLRMELKEVFTEKVDEVRFALSRLQKAQRAAEQALDMYDGCCGII